MTTGTSSDGPLVSMCCKPDVLYPNGSICYRDGYLPDETIVFPDIYDSNLTISTMSPSKFVRVYDFNCNNTVYYLNSIPVKDWVYHLTEDGALYVNITKVESTIYYLGLKDYCIASYRSENGTVGAVFFCKSYFDTAFLTAGTVSQLVELSLSIPFLAATFLVYAILSELRNVHGFNLRAYVGCLFVMYLSFVVGLTNPNVLCTYFIGTNGPVVFIVDMLSMVPIGFCASLAENNLWNLPGLGVYFWILASFFWLNVMCFDIWWTFRRFRSLQGSSKQEYRNKILIYSIYAWGSAALMTGVSAIIDSLDTVPMGVIKPGLREGNCWFSTATAVAIYLYGPMAVTIIANVCFFASTAITIIRHEKDTAHRLNGSDKRRHKDEKERFKLYLKLFMVMGITWLAELVPKLFTLPKYVTYILDLPNTLQGFSIFIIFVWKKKIKMLLFKRLGCADRTTYSTQSSTLTELSNANSR